MLQNGMVSGSAAQWDAAYEAGVLAADAATDKVESLLAMRNGFADDGRNVVAEALQEAFEGLVLKRLTGLLHAAVKGEADDAEIGRIVREAVHGYAKRLVEYRS